MESINEFKLPDHWEEIPARTGEDYFDDGRDYERPMYRRKDQKARIYYNQGQEGTRRAFGIVLDEDDGDCAGTLEEAVRRADEYVGSL